MKSPCEIALDHAIEPLPKTIKFLHVAAAALIDPDNRVLLVKRPDDKSFADLWEFPGGKIEAGETPEYALVRELEEELGIETRPGCMTPVGFNSHYYKDKNFHVLICLFSCRMWRNAPRAKEHKDLKWVKAQELSRFDMPEANMQLRADLLTQLMET